MGHVGSGIYRWALHSKACRPKRQGSLGCNAILPSRDLSTGTLEDGYLGLRSGDDRDPSFDLSVGPRESKVGTGILLANGASNGFERGALKLGPRKAWEMAALGCSAFGNFTGTAFYLDANELTNTDTRTQIVGATGFSVSFPGPGADSVVTFKAPVWTGGFADVVVNF